MKIKQVAICSFFAALTAILSQITIPIGPVPINFATFSVVAAGLILGAKFGALSQIVYVLLGCVGVPVFTMFRGGAAIILGPTGGYILGYIIAAFVSGLIYNNNILGKFALPFSALLGYLSYTIPGTIWFMISTESGLWVSLLTCVIPFIPGDIFKLTLVCLITGRLKTVLQKS